MRLIEISALTVLMVVLGCATSGGDRGARSDAAFAGGAPTGGPSEDASNGAKELSESYARKLAEVYAYQHWVLPQPMSGGATLEPNGSWLVVFHYDNFLTPEGKEVGLCINYEPPQVRVTPEGRCYAAGVDSSLPYALEGARCLPASLLTAEGVVMVAQVLAEQRGLVPTPTTVDAVRTSDGGWLFAFHPGVPFESTEGASLRPFSVYVSPGRNCTFVGEVKLCDQGE